MSENVFRQDDPNLPILTLIAKSLVARQQARARHEMARHARRRDLEQQVVGVAGGGG